jgi:GNAT superfamily N-acetyltransferase
MGGFMMLDCDEEGRSAGIWRLMIALEHQGKGYSTQVMQYAIDMLRQEGKFDYIQGGRGKYPSFGVNSAGVFINNLLVDSNGKGLYKREKLIKYNDYQVYSESLYTRTYVWYN